MNSYLLTIFLLIPSILMGQDRRDERDFFVSHERAVEIEKKGNGYKGVIEWCHKEQLAQASCADTSAIIDELREEYGIAMMVRHDMTKSIVVNDTCFFFVCKPVGFGESYSDIEVYVQVEDLWKLVAKGTVCDPWDVTVELDSCRNNFVFYTLRKKQNYRTGVKSVSKARNVGELSLDSLKTDNYLGIKGQK